MDLSFLLPLTLFVYSIFCHHLILVVNGDNPSAPCHSFVDVAIDCSSLGKTNTLYGRQWSGDSGSRSVMSMLQPNGKSRSSIVAHRLISADPLPHPTARVSATRFSYTFQVNQGQKFICLRFHLSSDCGSFALLRNTSASLAAHALGVKILVKKSCVRVEKNKIQNSTFSRSEGSKLRYTCAFVNEIEIIPMPKGLYYIPDKELGARIVGHSCGFYSVDNRTSMEVVHRLNIGGSSMARKEDFDMFASYLRESRFQPVKHLVSGVKYTCMAIFVAPDLRWLLLTRIIREVGCATAYSKTTKICSTSRNTLQEKDLRAGTMLKFNMVTLTCRYYSRHRFFNFGHGITEFSCHLIIVLPLHEYRHFTKKNMKGSVVISKWINVPDRIGSQHSWSHAEPYTGLTGLVSLIILTLVLVDIIVYYLRKISEQNIKEEGGREAASTEASFRCFSFAEIISATKNFSDNFIIGKGGFGNVYKGLICGGSEIVAIKRLKSNSKQGAHKFWTEIETLSMLRHKNLVSLKGYCNKCQEMILVYEYMPRGTLADNLYKIGRNRKKGVPLTGEQRLRICIGTACGLDYLHTGTECGVIHRDVKDTNILLDENFTAKISDFGLSKLENIGQSKSYVSTKVKGTFGYLDSNYFMTHKLTRKTDVYAFGVVLLVVLCGRPAVIQEFQGNGRLMLSRMQQKMRYWRDYRSKSAGKHFIRKFERICEIYSKLLGSTTQKTTYNDSSCGKPGVCLGASTKN